MGTAKLAIIVDDDEMDALHITKALTSVRPTLKTVWFSDPERALGEYDRLGEISFMMVDLNMPGQNGLEFLSSVRAKAKSTFPPVIIFSSSGQEDDRAAAYRARASAFVQKPNSLNGYRELAERCVGFWLDALEIDGRGP